jgi:putative ABC transport system permease protein
VPGRRSGSLVYVAFKEIRRSLGRFTLLSLAVALLVILLLFFQAVAGTLTSGLTGGLESSSADVLVYDVRARLNPANSLIPAPVITQVSESPDVAAVSPIGLSVFTGTTDGDEIDVQLVGGDPTGPSVPAEIAGGRLPRASGEALFSGSGFDNPIEIGQTVSVEGIDFEVVGTADDAAFNLLPTLYVTFEDFTSASQNRAGIPIEVAPSLLGVTVVDGADPADVAKELTESIVGIEALERSAAVDALPGVGQITQSFNILYVLLYIVVAIVTGVFFLILTVQKQDALVLLRAIGTSSRDVVTSVLIQVLVVVGAGAVIGTGVTAGLLQLTRDVFGASLDSTTTTLSVAAIVVLGLLASVGAVRRVLAIDPMQATRSGAI